MPIYFGITTSLRNLHIYMTKLLIHLNYIFVPHCTAGMYTHLETDKEEIKSQTFR